MLPIHQTCERPTRHLGRRVLRFQQVGSTNTLALVLALDPLNHGIVLLADEQTAGRGQQGRSWQAPPCSSVLMSVLLFPPPALRRPALLVSWGAVAVCTVVEALTGMRARIKWPNDVLVAGKKVCGILTEQRSAGTGDGDWPLATVVGLGLNVTQSAEDFAAAGLPDAGSLRSLSGRPHDTEAVAWHLLAQLDDDYGRLLDGDHEALAAAWKARLGLIGRRLRVETARETLNGRLRDVTFGGIDLELDGGQTVRIAPELVRRLEESGCGDARS